MTSPDPWALAMGVEKWIERWMTHYHVPAEMRADVRHGVMIELVVRADRWRPELGNWMTFATPWIRAFVPRIMRECQRELGNISPALRLPYRVCDYDFDERVHAGRLQEQSMVEDARDRRLAYARLRLRHRERVVIELVEVGMTLKEIGQQLGISRERARQIRDRAISTMRKHIDDSDGEDSGGALQRESPNTAGAGTCSSGRTRGMVRVRVPELSS